MFLNKDVRSLFFFSVKFPNFFFWGQGYLALFWGVKTLQTYVFFLWLAFGVRKYLSLSMLSMLSVSIYEKTPFVCYISYTCEHRPIGQHHLIFKSSLEMLIFLESKFFATFFFGGGGGNSEK